MFSKCSWSILIITPCLLAMQTKTEVANEDIRFIREWKMSQKAQQVAQELNLTTEQVQQLKQVKSEVEQIRTSFKQASEDLRHTLETLAKTGRAQIEANGQLDPSLESEILSIRRQLRRKRAESRLQIRLAALDLRDILEPEQLTKLPQARHREHRRTRARAAARFILSDAFLDQFQNP